jgi:hypothetical protein
VPNRVRTNGFADTVPLTTLVAARITENRVPSANHFSPVFLSMPNLRDEPVSLAIDNVPGIRTAQLGNAQCVRRTACIYLGADIGKPPAITSAECPHA